MPIFEPGLDQLVSKNVAEGRLHFTTKVAEAVAEADVVLIAVGTPSRRGDGHADLSYVFAAAREIAASLDGYTVVVTKSTVPVGTGDEVERIICEARPDADVAVESQILNSCVRARQSRISNIPTGSSWGRPMNELAKSWRTCIGRCTSIKHPFYIPAGVPPS